MLKQLAATFRPNEPAVGVPRRMPLVGIFLLITIYCVLVRLLSILNFPSWLILSSGIFVAAVAAGQALLFDGKFPRTASCWAGGLVTPVLVLGQLVYAVVTAGNFLAWLSDYWLPCLILILVGPWLGYLAGLFVASWFYLFAGSDSSAGASGAGEDGEAIDAAAASVPVPSRWMLTVRNAHPYFWNWRTTNPWMRACLGGVVTSISALIVSQLFNGPNRPMIGVCAFVMGAIVAGSRFWPKPTLLLPVVSALAGLQLGRQVSLFSFFLERPNATTPIILATTAVAFVGSLLLLSGAGWLKFFVTRGRSTDNRWRLATMLILGAHLFFFGYAFTFVIDYYRSPPERMARELAANGGRLYYLPAWTWPPAVEGFAAGNKKVAEHLEVFVHQCNCRGWTWVSLGGSDFANEDGHLLNDLNVVRLSLDGLDVDHRLFDHIESLRIKYYDLSHTNIGDEGLACLARVCNSGAINALDLTECPITPAGLAELAQLPSLMHLDLSGCTQLGGGSDWAMLPANPAVQQLSIENAGITDDIAAAISRAFPNLSHLHLAGNSLLTDGIVDVLSQMPSLAHVDLAETGVSHQRAAELERAGIRVSLDW